MQWPKKKGNVNHVKHTVGLVGIGADNRSVSVLMGKVWGRKGTLIILHPVFFYNILTGQNMGARIGKEYSITSNGKRHWQALKKMDILLLPVKAGLYTKLFTSLR